MEKLNIDIRWNVHFLSLFEVEWGPNDLSNTGIQTPNKSELRDNILQALKALKYEHWMQHCTSVENVGRQISLDYYWTIKSMSESKASFLIEKYSIIPWVVLTTPYPNSISWLEHSEGWIRYPIRLIELNWALNIVSRCSSQIEKGQRHHSLEKMGRANRYRTGNTLLCCQLCPMLPKLNIILHSFTIHNALAVKRR